MNKKNIYSIPDSKTHTLTIRGGCGYRYKTPALLVEGKYLESWGFPIGSAVSLKYSNGQIIISHANAN